MDNHLRTPDSVSESSLKFAGQRRINVIWEITQAAIAIMVTSTTLYVSAALSLAGEGTAAFLLISNAFFLVIGFYFGRTNHARTGGVGGQLAGDR